MYYSHVVHLMYKHITRRTHHYYVHDRHWHREGGRLHDLKFVCKKDAPQTVSHTTLSRKVRFLTQNLPAELQLNVTFSGRTPPRSGAAFFWWGRFCRFYKVKMCTTSKKFRGGPSYFGVTQMQLGSLQRSPRLLTASL